MRVTKSFLVREGLKKVLVEQFQTGTISCYDLARDLAGSIKGLPRNLAVTQNTWTASESDIRSCD